MLNKLESQEGVTLHLDSRDVCEDIDIDDDVIEENRKKRGPKTPLIGNLFPK